MPCRYGGVDSLLLWQGYPNIGLDDKNQFEMTESLPGGLAGLKDLVSQVTGFIPLLFSLLVDQEILKLDQIFSCKQLEFGFFSLTFLGIRTQTQQDRIMSRHSLSR